MIEVNGGRCGDLHSADDPEAIEQQITMGLSNLHLPGRQQTTVNILKNHHHITGNVKYEKPR
jgi:hypothetical protein